MVMTKYYTVKEFRSQGGIEDYFFGWMEIDRKERSEKVKCHIQARKIWIKTYGPIPKGYVIHHIDEDWRNNDLSNLKMVL